MADLAESCNYRTLYGIVILASLAGRGRALATLNTRNISRIAGVREIAGGTVRRAGDRGARAVTDAKAGVRQRAAPQGSFRPAVIDNRIWSVRKRSSRCSHLLMTKHIKHGVLMCDFGNS